MTTDHDIDQRIEAQREALVRLNEEAAALQAQSESTELVVAGGKAAKAGLAALRNEAFRKRQQIEAETSNMRNLLREKEQILRARIDQELEVQRAAAKELEAQLKPLQEMVKRAEEGIWTINLYFGRDEEIVTLLEGEPAALDEPVIIRQLVLAMDQEIGAAAESGGLSAAGINGPSAAEVFDEWIKDPRHLEQVLPERRGVVALRPRFDAKVFHDHEGKPDAWKAQAEAEAAQKTYFLIRNGGMLYRTWTEFTIPIHNLTPLADEFHSFFQAKDRDGNITGVLEPESFEWEEAEKAASYRQRHFMRVALILEGLLRRTAVFHPVHPDLSFLTPDSHKRGLVHIVSDAEALLTTGRPEFYDWLEQINGKAHVGMRVAGYFNSYSSTRPNGSDPPEGGRIYTLDAEEDGYWVIRYKPRQSWRTKRSSYLLDKFNKRYLVLDTASVADMEYYLQSRLNRHAYTDMFPVIRSAIKAKKEEAEREEPFKQMLMGVLAREVGTMPTREQVDELVDWYKLSARWHKPLVFQDPDEVPAIGTDPWDEVYEKATKHMPKYKRDMDETERRIHRQLVEDREKTIRSNRQQEAKAVKLITAEYKSRRGMAEREEQLGTTVGDIVKYARTLFDEDGADEVTFQINPELRGKQVLLVGARKDGRYVVYLNANDRNIFIHEVEFNRHGRLFTPNTESKGGGWWRLPGNRPERSYKVLYTSDRWKEWDREARAVDHLTDPEYDQFKREFHDKLPRTLERAAKNRARRTQDKPKFSILATFYETDDRRFRAIIASDEGTIPTTRLLTTEADQPEYETLSARWEKTRSGATLDMGYWPSSNPIRGYSGSEKLPWDRSDLLFKDEAAIDQLYAVVARWDHFKAERRKLAAVVDKYLHSIEQDWLDRAWAKAHAKFIDDYMDETLWPDHKKTIKIGFPHGDLIYGKNSHYRHAAFRRKGEVDFRHVVERLVEDGVVLDGKEVREAITMAKERGVDLTQVEMPSEVYYLTFKLPKEKKQEPEDTDAGQDAAYGDSDEDVEDAAEEEVYAESDEDDALDGEVVAEEDIPIDVVPADAVEQPQLPVGE